MRYSSALLGLLSSAGCSAALDLDLNDANSIKSAAKTIVSNIITLYGESNIPGLFPTPYYWWEAGLAMDSLVNYWALTGDDSYVNTTREALLWQISPTNNYLPSNQSLSEGNDDQSTWGLAAMTAAEKQFPAPASNVSWLELAQNVFDNQVLRWDNTTCSGGLRWQIYAFNNGYDYKNSMTNGNFALLAARLARFTGNQTYANWAATSVAWARNAGFVSSDGNVYDGADTESACASINRIQWTANSAVYIATAAYMSDVTGGSAGWSSLLDSVLTTSNNIFANPQSSTEGGILTESACAPSGNCDTDQLAFRAIFARALTSVNAFGGAAANSTSSSGNSTSAGTRNTVNTILQNSARGAAAQCSGGSNGTLCGNSWNSTEWDGTSGLGQDLSALEIILANLPATASATVNTTGTTNSTTTSSGGPSPSDPAAPAQASQQGSASGLKSSVFLSVLGLAVAVML